MTNTVKIMKKKKGKTEKQGKGDWGEKLTTM